MESEFTVEKGIEVQDRNLKEWKSKLLPHVFTALLKRAIRDNHKAENGYQIFRGDDMTAFVLNYPNTINL